MFARLTLFAAFAGASVAVVGQGTGAAPSGGGSLQSCDDRKFETTVMTTVNGQPRSQSVKICGVTGQSDADWRRTLDDALNKVQANESMAASTKQQIVAALKAEIGRLDMALIRPLGSGSDALAPGPGIGPVKPSIGSALTPPRPSAPVQQRSLQQDYGNLAPMPAPLPAPVATATASASVLPAVAAPRMSLLCSSQFDPRGTEECSDVYPSTIFTVRADERLAAGVSLRFLRKGTERGDVTLAALDAGQVTRIALPRGVCSGVTRGTLEIQVMRRPPGSNAARQVVDAYGPYDLRC